MFNISKVIDADNNISIVEPSAGLHIAALKRSKLFEDAESNIPAIYWYAVMCLTTIHKDNEPYVCTFYNTGNTTSDLVHLYTEETDHEFMKAIDTVVNAVPKRVLQQWYELMEVEFFPNKDEAKND